MANLGALQYDFRQNLTFYTPEEPECYSGMLAFSQGNRYGLIQPIEVDPSGFYFNWWYGDPEMTNFSPALP